MLALKMTDTKAFMKKLLLTEEFDSFLLSEASVTTFTTFRVDGTWHPDFFDAGASDAPSDAGTGDRPAALTWKLVRPILLGIIRGSRTPNHFRIVLKLADYNVQALLEKGSVPVPAEQIDGLFLNLTWAGDALTCTTGTALTVFSLDRTLDHVWDDMVQRFFTAHQIPFEVI